MSPPKVSVIITTHNRPNLLKRAIRSVFEQTYDNFDLHIVDDASDDNTREAVETIVAANDRVFYWRHEERRGLSAARNTGIACSDGEYIAFLDDDDAWKPECVSKRVGFLQQLLPEQNESLGVIYCGCEIHILDENRVTHNLPKIFGNIKEYACSHGLSTIPSTCLFPRRVLDRIGGFDEILISSVDHDIWMNLALHGYCAYGVNEPLALTFLSKQKNSMVGDTTQRIRGVEQYLEKWNAVYKAWFGFRGGQRYVRTYRTQVLGGLAAKKFFEGDLNGAILLLKHVMSRNWPYISEYHLIAFLFLKFGVRKFTPVTLLKRFWTPHQKTT